MVLQFVGFLGAWNQPGQLPPLLAGTLGALSRQFTADFQAAIRLQKFSHGKR
jgi:hypothetical protein